jgi:hypothetical protein
MGVYSLSRAGGLKTSRINYSSMLAGKTPPIIKYTVVAGGGGGGGGGGYAGGGGAGGFRSSFTNQISGGASVTEEPLKINLGTSYTATIGSGGTTGTKGFNSVFATITSEGGGYGGNYYTASPNNGANGGPGGSGGGGGSNTGTGGTPTANQGFIGGVGTGASGAGGGGAGGAGFNLGGRSGAGSGVTLLLNGQIYSRGGNGMGSGTSGQTAGPVNTGIGGDGGNSGSLNNGGSGIIFLIYPSEYTITIGAGLTGSTTTIDGTSLTTITAGTGNVSWAA